MKCEKINKNNLTETACFQRSKIRMTKYKNKWWFVLSDIVGILTTIKDRGNYIKKKKKLKKNKEIWDKIVVGLRVNTVSHEQYANCANIEGVIHLFGKGKSPKTRAFIKWIGSTILKG